MGWLNTLLTKADLCRNISSGCTFVALLMGVAALRSAGMAAIRRKLDGADNAARKAAREKVRKGLALSRKKTQESGEDVDLLINGLDEWRALGSRARSRNRSLKRAALALAPLTIFLGVIWIAPLTGENESYVTLLGIMLWAATFAYFVWLVTPILWALLEHGMTEQEPATSQPKPTEEPQKEE